ncbi:MAG: sigma-70 family RNA polymerase sigma factor [Ruminococcaceae bacterium]|nr:sigma-70 family RNA polymerase sigma factor [Oscillospiraceae bacterium]
MTDTQNYIWTDTETGGKFDANRADLLRYQAGDTSLEAVLMERNAPLVNGLACRFRGRGVEYEDLVQIGSIGMLKAIRSFDCERGTAFSTYAVPLIIGEIRRFLRDDGMIKVSRNQKRIGAMLMREREKYLAEQGCEPTLEILAEAVGLSPEEAAVAMDASMPVHSLSEVIGDEDYTLENVIPAAEDTLGKMLEHIALEEIIGTLPELWRKILLLRYYREYSQQQTADALGLTQVKISREEKKIFTRLRQELA